MSNFWSGSADNVISGSTPFGIYDTDTEYQTDGPKVASWCAKRLGYPIVDVELVDLNFYACFEEAVSEYSAQVNQFNIKNNLTSLQGQPTGSDYTQKKIAGNPLPNLIEISDSYGTYANVGGKVDVKKGNIELNSGSQEYDLQSLWADVSESGNRINVTKVFYEATPAINKFFDPYSVSGQGTLNLIDEFGFGSFSPAAQFVLMPIYEDLLRIGAIEFNDQIRKSAYSFQLRNNKLKIFPIPEDDYTLHFEYIVKKDRDNTLQGNSEGVITDVSNAPYDNMEFKEINDVGKQWIKKYALALCKELLGTIRSKYASLPIPNAETTLDGDTLRNEATAEKEFLMTQLSEMLEKTSRKSLLEADKDEAEFVNEKLGKVPTPIFIG